MPSRVDPAPAPSAPRLQLPPPPPPRPSPLLSTSRPTPTSSPRSLAIVSGLPTLLPSFPHRRRPSRPLRPSTLSDTSLEPRRSATSFARPSATSSPALPSTRPPPRPSLHGYRTTATPNRPRLPLRPSPPPPPTPSHRSATPISLASRTGSSAPRPGHTISDPRVFTMPSPLTPTSTSS